METTFVKNKDDILYLVSGKKEELQCCLKEGYTVLDGSTAEGAGEKHLPVIERRGNKVIVKVGSIYHPMTEEHSIGWIFLETKLGGQLIRLKAGEEPIGEFLLNDKDEAVAAYAYCNLHGFWKAEIR